MTPVRRARRGAAVRAGAAVLAAVAVLAPVVRASVAVLVASASGSPNANDADSSVGSNAAEPSVPPNALLLYDAASKGDFETVKNLLADEPQLATLKLKGGVTPLHGAALADDPRVAEALLAAGAPVDARGGGQDLTPLFLAAIQDHPAVARVLLRHRASPSAVARIPLGEGMDTGRPLHAAAAAGATRVVHELIAHGASLDARSGAGKTIDQCARQSGRYTTIVMVGAYRRYGVTRGRPIGELLAAIVAADSLAVQGVLDRHPRTVNARLVDEATPLHVAADAGNAAVCRVLLAHGADAAAREKGTNWTPALRASSAGYQALATELNRREAAGVTPR